MSHQQGHPGDQCLQEYMLGEKHDTVLLKLCSSYIITYGKGNKSILYTKEYLNQ